ncbi:MAG: aminotransferase class IV [Proteobacteria bacterium]|nr:aminotransferase class IV [Pseudomonadota bacterium]
MSIAYLNGQYLPLTEAKISPLDRGFLFGDGVYEVIPVYNGKIFHAEKHLHRLSHSLKSIGLTIDVSETQWNSILNTLVEKNGVGDLAIYLQITRGAEESRNYPIPKKFTPTIFVFTYVPPKITFANAREGISAITLPDIRWSNCHIKAITLLPNVLLNQQAADQGSQEAILIREGYAIEGTSSNLFIVKNGVIQTTPLSPQILGGITRDVILEIAKQKQIPVEETFIFEDLLAKADEIWMCSSTREIRPVVKLNDHPVGTGKAGPLWEQMFQWFQEYKNNS